MKSTTHLSLLFALAAGPAFAANPPATPTPATANDSVIGRIGEIQVNAAEVRASIAGLSAQDGAAVSRDPALLSQVVRSLLVQRALLKEAEAKQHDKTPEVAERLARAREVALTESYLQSVSVPPESYPNDAELKAAYEAAKPSIGVPKSWRLAQVFISSPKTADKETTDKAGVKLDTVRKALKAAGADFSKIAAANSDEPTSAGRGGEIGWLAETQIQPEIREALGTLKVDSVSEALRLDDGWHFIKVLDAREPYTPTLDQIRGQFVAQLRAEKTKANSQAYLAKLLQDNPLAINELELPRVLAGEK